MKAIRNYILSFFFLVALLSNGQSVVYSYEGDFNEESTSFGLRITETASEAGHTHHGEYLIVMSSRDGSEMYHFRLNSQYYGAFPYHLERLSGNVLSNDNLLVTNTSTQFNLEIRFHGNQDDWHRVTVHELTPPRSSNYPTFLKIDPSQFSSTGTQVETNEGGIGVTNPSADFHVRGDAINISSTQQRDANLLIESSGTRDVSKGAVLGFGLSSSTSSESFWQHGRIMVVPDTPSNNRADGKMLLQTRYYNGSAWAWRNSLTLNSSGDVAIGTLTPGAKFHIEGTSSTYSRIANSGGNTRLTFGAVTGRNIIYSQNYSGAPQILKLQVNNENNFVIGTNGHVGIGSANPDAKLTVDGTIHSEEVKVDLSVPGPDYVFEEDYDLRSLEETEAYIKANKHLPEIPSAKEMEANGVVLGEMNMLLLKKIEELTLHVIELKKEINNLKDEND